MKNRNWLLLLFVILSLNAAEAQIQLSVESGLVTDGYNDIRIPGDSGTLFSASDELQSDPAVYFRLRAAYSVSAKSTFLLLFAPLSLEARGTSAQDIHFMDKTFSAGQPLKTTYTFNSYRLTYRYDVYQKPHLAVGVGFTAKIRDAAIELKGDGHSAQKSNTGFVPLLHFRVIYQRGDKWGWIAEGDALAAPQGRAEDVFLGLLYQPLEKLGLQLGYRLLEGGADNDEVYNFALFHFLSVSANWTF